MSPLNVPSSGPPESARPTHVRWHMVALLVVITALTYADRLNLAIAGKYIQDEFSFSTETMGWILSAFVLGYALFQIPGGWAGDRHGPRGVLTFAIVWWSIFTAATALVPQLPLRNWIGLVGAFFLIRFLIGVGEASAFPNENKIVAFWLGHGRRGVGNSLFLAGIGLGGTLTPFLIAWIMRHWGWRASFYLCGLVGIVVALVWHFYATNHPEQHPRVNAAELALIHASRGGEPHSSPARTSARPRPPWKKFFSSRSTWGLMLSYFCEAYPNYIFYTWFFIYLVRVRGLTIEQGGIWGAAPFLAILLLAPLGGWFSDRAVARFGKRRGRQSTVWVGMALSALLMTTGAHATGSTLAIVLLAGAAGFNLFATSAWWATCIDLTRNFSGSLSAVMNTWGNLGGWVSPILTAYIATHFGWTRALDFAAAVTLLACIFWFFINAE